MQRWQNRCTSKVSTGQASVTTLATPVTTDEPTLTSPTPSTVATALKSLKATMLQSQKQLYLVHLMVSLVKPNAQPKYKE